MTNSSGVVKEAYDTDAYGNTLIFRNAGNPPATIAFTNSDTQVDEPTCRYIFTGREYDPESEIYWYRARYYVPELGRFSSRDPFVYRDSLNTFSYVGGGPLTFIDPHGLGRREAPVPHRSYSDSR